MGDTDNQHTARYGFYVTVLFKMSNFITIWISWVLVQQLSYEWQSHMNDLDVYTIRMEEFWGPVHMLVPKNCEVLKKMQHTHHGTGHGPQSLNPFARPASTTAEIESTRLGSRNTTSAAPEEVSSTTLSSRERKATQAPEAPVQLRRLERATVTSADARRLLQWQVCNEVQRSLDPTVTQRYFAMFHITAAISPKTSLDEVRRNRKVLSATFFFFIIVFVLIQVMLERVIMKQVLPSKDYAGVRYKPVENQALKKTPTQYVFMYVRVFPRKFLMNWISLSQQAAFMSLYVTYWDENHYIIQYIPGAGWICMYMVIMCFLAMGIFKSQFREYDRMQVCLNKMVCSYFCFLVPGVVVPMFIWMLYNMNFLYGQAKLEEVIQDVSGNSAANFPKLVHEGKQAVFMAVIIHAMEALVSPAVEVYHMK